MTDIAKIAAGLTPRMRPAVMALDGEFRSAASCVGVTPQAVQGLVKRFPQVVDREFQDGCAKRWYYRLNATGLALQAYLQENTDA